MYPRFVMRVATATAVAAAFWAPTLASAQSQQTVEITDIGGFAQPMTAATVQIPAGWRTEGAVIWHRASNCVGNRVRYEWSARSRDDLQGVEIMPTYSWQVQGTQNQMNPCPPRPFRSAREFLEAVVKQRRPGARVLEYRDRPDIVAAGAGQANPNPQVRRRTDSGQVLIGYQSNGVEFREVLGTTVNFTELQGNVVGGAGLVFAHRAPNGQLDFAFGEGVVGSFRYNRQWGEQMINSLKDSENRFSSSQSNAISQWHAREMSRINAEGAADRAAIRSAANRDVAKIYSDVNANTQATNDGIHRRSLEAVGEYSTYQDPSGTRVRSSIHGGARVLRNANGSYVSTDDPYFNPAGSRELQRVR